MIHFSINKNLFLQALNTTKRAISSKNAIPILSTVKIDVTNEGVTLIGSNSQIFTSHLISIDFFVYFTNFWRMNMGANNTTFNFKLHSTILSRT